MIQAFAGRSRVQAKLARRSVAIVGLLGCCAFIVPAALTGDAYIAIYCLTASMFFLECTIGPSWAVPMDTGGKYSGTVSGMMNMAGNFGGAISPIVFGYLANGGNWQAPFIVAARPKMMPPSICCVRMPGLMICPQSNAHTTR